MRNDKNSTKTKRVRRVGSGGNLPDEHHTPGGIEAFIHQLIDESAIERDHAWAWACIGLPGPEGTPSMSWNGLERLRFLKAEHLELEKAYAAIQGRAERAVPLSVEECRGLIAVGTSGGPLRLLLAFAHSAGLQV